eukprot:11258978-Ditylum_brightwellii.AAC.1
MAGNSTELYPAMYIAFWDVSWRASDPVPSDNICPSCSLPVHPICEVWNAEQEEYICLLCEKTRNRISTAPSAEGGVAD